MLQTVQALNKLMLIMILGDAIKNALLEDLQIIRPIDVCGCAPVCLGISVTLTRTSVLKAVPMVPMPTILLVYVYNLTNVTT